MRWTGPARAPLSRHREFLVPVRSCTRTMNHAAVAGATCTSRPVTRRSLRSRRTRRSYQRVHGEGENWWLAPHAAYQFERAAAMPTLRTVATKQSSDFRSRGGCQSKGTGLLRCARNDDSTTCTGGSWRSKAKLPGNDRAHDRDRVSGKRIHCSASSAPSLPVLCALCVQCFLAV